MEVLINITSQLKKFFDPVKKTRRDAWELALKQPIPGKQLVLMTDATFRNAGFALMIEDNPNQKCGQNRKSTPREVWLKNCLPRATQNFHIL